MCRMKEAMFCFYCKLDCHDVSQSVYILTVCFFSPTICPESPDLPLPPAPVPTLPISPVAYAPTHFHVLLPHRSINFLFFLFFSVMARAVIGNALLFFNRINRMLLFCPFNTPLVKTLQWFPASYWQKKDNSTLLNGLFFSFCYSPPS